MTIAANVILGGCALLALLNWMGLFGAIWQKRSYSFAPPLLCGVVGAFVVGFHPDVALRRYFWIPLFLDPSVVAIALALVNPRRKSTDHTDT